MASLWPSLPAQVLVAEPVGGLGAPRLPLGRSLRSRCPARRTRAHGRRTVARAQGWQEDASSQSTDVVISGAGVCGLATALALTRVGLRVLVVERCPALSQGGAALSLWGNAWRALDALEVGDLLRPSYIPLQQVDILTDDERPLRSFSFDECGTGPGGRPHEVRGVRRAHLLQVLQEQLPAGTVLYGSEVGGTEERAGGETVVRVTSADGTERSVTAQAVIGCDGANSPLATQLGLPPVQYSGYLASRGVAELDPANASHRALASSLLRESKGGAGASAGPEGRIRMLWGRGVRAGIYPLSPTLFYWFTCVNCLKQSPDFDLFERLKDDKTKQKEATLASVPSWKGGLRDIVEATPASDISTDLITDRWAFPALLGGRLGRGGLSLAGDAAHPMTPNLGQGACTALEDAVVLAQHLGRAAAAPGAAGERTLEGRTQQVREALQSFESARTKRVAPIVLRSNAIGAVLQIDNPLVCALRDQVILPYVFSPSHFLDHALFDCGDLSEASFQ